MSDNVGFLPLEVDQDGSSIKITVDSGIPSYYNRRNVQALYGEEIDFTNVGVALQTTGAGLDDLTSSGVNTGDNPEIVTYEVKLKSADTPDEFQWRKKIGNQPFTAFSASIAVTGSAQELENNVFITFAATTGHTLNDAWQFLVKESVAMNQGEVYPHDKMFRCVIKYTRRSLIGHDPVATHFDIQDVTNQAGWTADSAGLAQALADINGWLLTSAFNPSDLSLDLDIRTPNIALTDITRSNNSLIGFNNNDGVDPDINCIIDQSKALAVKANIKTSDFSAGIDGFSASNTTIAGNIDGIFGEDNTLRVTGDSVSNRSSTFLTTLGFDVKVIRIQGIFLIPTANTVVTHLSIQNPDAGTSWRHVFQGTADTWIPFDIYLYNFGTDEIRFTMHNGTTDSFDDLGEILYLKNIVIDEIDGFHWIQDIVAKMGHWDNTNFTIDADGTDDVYEDLDGAFYTARINDLAGEQYQVFDDDEGAGNNVRYFNMIPPTGIGRVFQFGLQSTSDKAHHVLIDGGTTNTVVFGSSALTRSVRMSLFFGTDELAYSCNAQGSDLTVFSGADSGDHFGDIIAANLTAFEILARSPNSLFDAGGIRGLFYRASQFTAQERTDLKTWSDLNI